MIKLKSLLPLNEERLRYLGDFGNEENINQIKNFIAAHCEEALKLAKKGILFYRGDKAINLGATIIDPKDSPRMSVDSKNFYVMVMDASPAWKHVPSRTYSLIAGSSFTASEFGNAEKQFVVLPIGNPLVAVSLSSDLFDSYFNFFGELYTVSKFDSFLADFLNSMGFKPNSINRKNVDVFLSDLRSTLESFFSGKPRKDYLSSTNQQVVAKWKDAANGNIDKAIELLFKEYTPQNMNILTKNFSEIQVQDADHEMWTEGKCILIDRSNFNTHRIEEI